MLDKTTGKYRTTYRSSVHQAATSVSAAFSLLLTTSSSISSKHTKQFLEHQRNGVRGGPEHSHGWRGPMVCLQQDTVDRHW
jgi:hypothetical protein